MNINIQEIVDQKISEMDASGVITKMVGDMIEKTILKTVTETFESYHLRGMLHDKLEKEVSEVAANIGFTAYNSFIAQKLKEIIEGTGRADVADKIRKTFDSILIAKRESIKLSEIFEQYRNWLNESENESDKHDRGKFHVKFEEDDLGWYNIELAKERNSSQYSSSTSDMIKFALHKKYSEPGWGWIGSTYIDQWEVKKNWKIGHMSEFECLLVNLVYNETPIEIDVESEDDIDDSYDVDD
jgi:hypothetical protein